jgi:hypothetical protein
MCTTFHNLRWATHGSVEKRLRALIWGNPKPSSNFHAQTDRWLQHDVELIELGTELVQAGAGAIKWEPS